LLDAIDTILGYNGVSLKTYFRTLKPLEFTDLENVITEEQVVEETGVDATNLSSDSQIANALIELGEEPKEEWLLIDEFAVDYDTDDSENELLSKEPKQSLLSKVYNFVSQGTPLPNNPSKQDQTIDGVKFITRYVYAGDVETTTREFCRKMIEAGKIYRKEDILTMGSFAVNAGWGPKGADTYNIWLYKGGGNCHHRWNKQVYASFEGVGIDVNSPNAKQIAVKKAEKFGYVIKNPKLVSTRPVDMPNYGFLPSNPQSKRKIIR
jgi:hypothetical protein